MTAVPTRPEYAIKALVRNADAQRRQQHAEAQALAKNAGITKEGRQQLILAAAAAGHDARAPQVAGAFAEVDRFRKKIPSDFTFTPQTPTEATNLNTAVLAANVWSPEVWDSPAGLRGTMPRGERGAVVKLSGMLRSLQGYKTAFQTKAIVDLLVDAEQFLANQPEVLEAQAAHQWADAVEADLRTFEAILDKPDAVERLDTYTALGALGNILP